MGPVEIITSVQRRRHWTAGQKKAMVEEADEPGNSLSSVARKYEVHPNQLFRWRGAGKRLKKIGERNNFQKQKKL